MKTDILKIVLSGITSITSESNIDAKLRKNIKLRFDVSGRQEAEKVYSNPWWKYL